jgi:hypothetical protein
MTDAHDTDPSPPPTPRTTQTSEQLPEPTGVDHAKGFELGKVLRVQAPLTPAEAAEALLPPVKDDPS